MQRVLWPDILKCVLMFFVIWGHLIQYYGGGISSVEWKFIYSFHMPAFMLLSGMFFSTKKSYAECIKNRAVQCILPGITAAIILYLLGYKYVSIGEMLNGMVTNFWFLKCLLICTLFYYPIKKGGRKRYISIVVLILVYLFVKFNLGEGNIYKISVIDKVFNMFGGCISLFFLFPFFVLGNLLYTNNMLQNIRHKKMVIAISFIAFCCLLYGFSSSYTIYFSDSVLPFSDLHSLKGYVYASFYRYAIGFVGCLFFVLVASSIKYSNDSKVVQFISKVGQHTLAIYILQTFIIEYNVFSIPFTYFCKYSILRPLVAIFVLVVIYFLARLIKRLKPVALVLLGSK